MAIHATIHTERGEAVDALYKMCNEVAAELASILIERRSPSGYARVGSFTVSTEEGEEPSTGDEIAQEIVRIAIDHVGTHGPGTYRVVAQQYGRGKQRGALKVAFTHSFTIEEGATAGGVSPADYRRNRVTDEVLDMSKMFLAELRTQRGQEHSYHLKVLESLPKVIEAQAAMAAAFPASLQAATNYSDVMIRGMELHREDKHEEREVNADETRRAQGLEALKLLAKYYFGTSGQGAPATPGKEPFVGKVHAFMASVKKEERAPIAAILGEEAVSLLDAAAAAANDQECRAVLNKLFELWGSQGLDVATMIPKIGPIIGKERFMALGDILVTFGTDA
jgi:hypothetical protein